MGTSWHSRLKVWDVRSRVGPKDGENQVEKNMDNFMEAGVIWRFRGLNVVDFPVNYKSFASEGLYVNPGHRYNLPYQENAFPVEGPSTSRRTGT